MASAFGRDAVVWGAALLLFPVAAQGPVAGRARLAPVASLSLRISAPADGASIRDGSAPILLSFKAPEGQVVPPESLSFSRFGSPLAMDCRSFPGGAECSPYFPFEDGEVALEVRAASRPGYRAPAPQRVVFTVDSSPPEILLDSPRDSFLSATGALMVAGRLSEPATLEIGGIPVPVADDLRFAYELPLAEGANVLLLSARDSAGNETVEARSGFCDSLPPPPLAPDRVALAFTGKRVAISGSAGAAEPGARLRLRNERTGQLVETDASRDGAFGARLVAEPGDRLAASAVDAFDHASEPLGLDLPLPEPLAPPLPSFAFGESAEICLADFGASDAAPVLAR